MKKWQGLTLVMILAATAAWACNVPVYRYALERWQADPYRAMIVHDRDLTEKEKAWIEKLENVGGMYPQSIYTEFQDTRKELSKQAQEWREANPDVPLPRAVLQYPAALRYEMPFYDIPMNDDMLEFVETSPIRREIARELLQNATAVWLFINGKDDAQNAEQKKRVREALDELEETIQLNESFLAEVEMMGNEGAEYLNIRFPLIEMDRDDPDEKLLWELLATLTEDVRNAEGPILIPIYGRARAMAIMLKEYINKDYIADASYFMTGACSCEIKAGNPGFDLLIPIAWDDFIMGQLVVEEELPPLTGLSSLIEEKVAAEETAPEADDVEAEPVMEDAEAEVEEDASSGSFSRNLLLIAGGAVLIIGVGTFLLGRRSEFN